MGENQSRGQAEEAFFLSADERPGARRAGALHGRRKGKKLRTYHAGLIDDLLPKLTLDVSGPIDPAALFDFTPADLRLEIGFGGGEHLAAEAARAPLTGFIGCEPFVNGVAKLLAEIDSGGLRNILIHSGDAADVIARLPAASLAQVDLLYPDPWPKRRQRKRRFVSDASLAQLARALRPGGELRFATDIDDYAGWTLARVLRSPDFVWEAEGPLDWMEPWPGWTRTRYEEKAVREGRPPVYLTFRRR